MMSTANVEPPISVSARSGTAAKRSTARIGPVMRSSKPSDIWWVPAKNSRTAARPIISGRSTGSATTQSGSNSATTASTSLAEWASV